MTPAERVVRLKQLHDQVKALNEEIAQLEAEDEQYVAFRQRSQQAGRKLLAYLDYVRYSAFREQLEAARTAAGRPRGWDKAPLLLKLREVLLVVGADTGGPAPVAPVVGRVAPTSPASPPGVPHAGAAPASPSAPARAAGALAGRPGSRSGPAPVTASQLIEMHAPILSEVGELTSRALEEFRMGQTASALGSIERATYLLERVAHAPAAMSQRLIKVLDDGLKEGALAEADRARREHVRGRISTVLEADIR